MERDDIIEYSLDAHHSEEQGKAIRKKIYFVTILLSLITLVEVVTGVFASGWEGWKWETVKWFFIILTLVKAGYIVTVFMHLGEERKTAKYMILIPYAMFVVYLICLALTEANYVNEVLQTFL
ncbi:MAG: cytochrome c oxidase subunit 4 [Sphingobacteriales bacterium]|jgi:cytochrome c oxidase subunit 4